MAHDHHDHKHDHGQRHERFDDAAQTWDDDPSHEARQQVVAELIAHTVDLTPETKALDIGGGTGRLSILLADQVGSVLITDPSAGMVAVAVQRIAESGVADRLHARQADLTHDQLDETFDVAWSSLAFHHVLDLDALLANVAGSLVSGGRLAIADLERDPDGAFHADKVDFDGHHGFDRAALAEQLQSAGFEDVRFADATSIEKQGRDFGVFLCTAVKRA
ncbi:MAG: class I SAM-dependent methyltransferase [Nocardioides sp.]|jgi:ubiquinone/menaquinone biosynthesis C-methylase UbiE